ncbi:SET and MYND domain-containing protein 4-like [Achroia grisella]|uniref:SET and MYND domain-containing protein 4-like n=1 Tax=Achroia grisella TaxID=688607 RepID=UPI0027D33AF1|nr:SET and MYND domain-containing protein 4-like [Achroia grisella]
MSIDECYERVIAKLTSENRIKEISLKLLSLSHNDDRVLYVYDILGSLDVFPDLISVSKSEDVSIHYRLLGNQCYGKKENYTAIQYYNLSLLYAPMGSDCYSVVLSNRSAVFLTIRKYNECLNDVEEVLKSQFPPNLKNKLIKRKETCLSKLTNIKLQNEDNQDIKQIFTLQGPKDPRYICASSKLDVVYTETMGRHVVAKEDIKVGEVLVQEEPYTVLLLKSQYLVNCSYCLSTSMNLLPCTQCCYVLYCSETCRDNAWKHYHKIECPLMSVLLYMEFTKLEWLALRTVIKARNDHNDWTELFNKIDEAEKCDMEYKGQVKVHDEWVYDSKYYESIHTLSSNIEKRSVSDIFQKSVTAAVFLYMLIEYTNFLNAADKDVEIKARKCVAGMLLHHIMTVPINMHGIQSTKQSANGNYVDEISIASGAYAYHSLLNHSCSPNVVRTNRMGSTLMTLIALRPIKKGMQIFDNYGSHHALQNYEERQNNLRFQYKFTCCCEACVNKWPLYFNIPRGNLPSKIIKQIQELLSSDFIEKLQKGDLHTAMTLYKPLCTLAENLEPYAPCTELSNCQETLKQCLQIFTGLIPFELSKIVEWGAYPPQKCMLKT